MCPQTLCVSAGFFLNGPQINSTITPGSLSRKMRGVLRWDQKDKLIYIFYGPEYHPLPKFG